MGRLVAGYGDDEGMGMGEGGSGGGGRSEGCQ